MKDNLRLLSGSVILGIVLYSINGGENDADMIYILVQPYCYLNTNTISVYVLSIMFWLCPQVQLLMYYGDFTKRFFVDMFPYTRTRVADMSPYIMKLFFHTLVVTAVSYGVMIVIAGIGCHALSMTRKGVLLLSCMCVIIVLYHSFVILCQNLLSTKIGVINSIIFVITIEILGAYAGRGIEAANPILWASYSEMISTDILILIVRIGLLLIGIFVLFFLYTHLFNRREELK